MISVVDYLRATEAERTRSWLAGYYVEAGHRAKRLNCVAADAASARLDKLALIYSPKGLIELNHFFIPK